MRIFLKPDAPVTFSGTPVSSFVNRPAGKPAQGGYYPVNVPIDFFLGGIDVLDSRSILVQDQMEIGAEANLWLIESHVPAQSLTCLCEVMTGGGVHHALSGWPGNEVFINLAESLLDSRMYLELWFEQGERRAMFFPHRVILGQDRIAIGTVIETITPVGIDPLGLLSAWWKPDDDGQADFPATQHFHDITFPEPALFFGAPGVDVIVIESDVRVQALVNADSFGVVEVFREAVLANGEVIQVYFQDSEAVRIPVSFVYEIGPNRLLCILKG